MSDLEGILTIRHSPRIFYGWAIVAAGGLVQAYTSAVFWRGFQAFFDPIVETFGWSRGATAAAVSLQRTEGGMISPFVGRLIDRYGPRWVMLVGVVITGASFILMSRVTSLWHFYAAMALLTLGMSLGTFIVLVTTVGNWFIRRRARALAVLMSCTAIGGFALPLLVSSIDSFGWRDVLFAVGVGFWIVGFPAAFVMRQRPEQYGLAPDGDHPGEADAERPRLLHEPRMGVREVLRTRFFWQFSLASSLGQLVSSTNLLHLSALKDFGVSPGFAAVAVGSIAIGDFIGRISTGFIGDRFDKRWVLAGAYFFMVVGTLSLGLVNLGLSGGSLGSTVPITVFVIGCGMGFGISIPLRFAMLADYVGRRSFGSILGIASTAGAVLGAVGPVFVGLTFDLTGGYRPAFLILAAVTAFAIPLSLTLESPSRFAAKVRRAASIARSSSQTARPADISRT